MANTKYTHAIVSRVPEVFAIDKRSNTSIHIEEARRQHAGVVNAVRSLGLDVLELPPDETNVASVFTQDLAVVINGIALMCRPSASRDGKCAAKIRQVEVDTMRAVLRKELNQAVVDPRWSATALLSGSDVLFTGREFFVGLSCHTNMEGALAVASTWPEYPCTPIKIDGPYNLKYFLNMAGPDVICVSSSGAAQVVLKRIEREASHRYQTLTLPEEGSSACLFVNGTLVHRTKEETPKCDAVFNAKFDYPRKAVALSEFAKSQPCRPVSSLFLLLRKSKHVRRL